MSNPNPYAPTSAQTGLDDGIRKIKARPLKRMSQAYQLMGDQYWLFVAITFVASVVASLVPFGLIAGTMAVGVYLCFIDREKGNQVEFATLFRSFDYFVESLVAFLIYFFVSLLAMAPFLIAIVALVVGPVLAAAGAGAAAPPQLPATTITAILILYPMLFIANIVALLPFCFTFQLIADRNLKAVDAVKTSAKGVFRNFASVTWFVFVTACLAGFASMMCFLPIIPLMPILVGAYFLLFREIYGPNPTTA